MTIEPLTVDHDHHNAAVPGIDSAYLPLADLVVEALTSRHELNPARGQLLGWADSDPAAADLACRLLVSATAWGLEQNAEVICYRAVYEDYQSRGLIDEDMARALTAVLFAVAEETAGIHGLFHIEYEVLLDEDPVAMVAAAYAVARDHAPPLPG
jgi:hypothetical protein